MLAVQVVWVDAQAQVQEAMNEITREKLFLRLHQELPYSSHVETEKWEERKDGSVRIEQVIYVERDSQKAIIIGHKGSRLAAVGARARAHPPAAALPRAV